MEKHTFKFVLLLLMLSFDVVPTIAYLLSILEQWIVQIHLNIIVVGF